MIINIEEIHFKCY